MIDRRNRMSPGCPAFWVLAVAGLVLAAPAAKAQTYYWDGGAADIVGTGNGLSLGGSGDWSTAISNWDTGAGLSYASWPTTSPSSYTAVFAGTAGTVTLVTPITVGGLTFNTSGYTIAAGAQGLTFGAADNTINLASAGATTAIISGTVAGGGNVVLAASNSSVGRTVTFTGASATGWSGTTTINAGITLATTSASGAINRVLSNTSGITLNGGAIQFNRATNAGLNAISDSAAITVNGGGTFGVTSADAGGVNAIESIGAVTVNSGQMNFNWTNGASSGAQIIMSGLTLSSPTAAVTFSGNLGSTGRWKVTGAGSTTAGQIIGPWGTTGAANGIAAQTDYAVYSSDFVAAANIAASAQSTWTTTAAASSNYTMSALASATISGGTKNINSLRATNNAVTVTANSADIALASHNLIVGDVVTFSATTIPTGLTAGTPYYVVATGAGTIQVSATAGGVAIVPTTAGATVVAAGAIQLSSGNNLGTTGILNGAATTLNILQSGGAGSVTLPTTTSANLFVTAGNGAIAIATPISDNGAGVLTLVKSGNNTLSLSGPNNFTGDIVINAGTLAFANNASWGGTGKNLAFDGSGTLNAGSENYTTGQVTVRSGVVATIGGSGTSGVTLGSVTGSGTITYTGNNRTLSLIDASAFQGSIRTTTNGGTGTIQFASLGDDPGTGTLQFGGGDATSPDRRRTIRLFNDSGPQTFDNRRVEILPRSTGSWGIRTSSLENNNASVSNTWVINTALLNTSDRNPEIQLAGSNVGNNEFAGVIGDSTTGAFVAGTSGITTLLKTGAGKWIVSGANTFTGVVVVNDGTLSVSTLNGTGVDGPLGRNAGPIQLGGTEPILSGGTSVLSGTNSGTLEYTGAAVTSARTFQVGDTAAANTGGGGIASSGTGAITFSAANFNPTITGITATRTLTLSGTNAGNNTIQGIIQDNAGAGLVGLTKTGIGTWLLGGANTYSGTNTVSLGTLRGTQTSGTPFGTGAVTLGAGTLSIAPSGSSTNVAVTGGTVAAGTLFTFNADAALSLNKGSQTSLTYTFGGTGVSTARGTNGTLILSTGDIANFGTAGSKTERFIVNGTAPTVVNTLVSGVVIQDRNTGNAGDFAAYDGTDGFTKAAYTHTDDFTGSTNISRVEIANATSTSGATAAYAIKVSGATLTNTGNTITLGNAANTAGLILNGATISGGTLATPAAAAEFVIYTSGTSEISSVIPTATGMIGMSVFGPGSLALTSGSANGFTGGLRINNTTVIATNNNQLGATTSAITLTGGTLQTSGTFALGGAGQRAIALNPGQDQPGGTFNVTGGITTFQNANASSKVLSGAGTLTKTGAGTLALTGNTPNTYTGGSFVNGGTLLANIAGATGTGAVTVGGALASNAPTLGGSGTISGPVVVASAGGGVAGTLAPGNGVGTLTVSNNITFNPGSTFFLEINGLTAGTEYDRLVLTFGTINLGNATVSGTTGFVPSSSDLFFVIDNQTGSPVSGTFATDGSGRVTVGDYTYEVSYTGQTGTSFTTGGNDVVIFNAAPVPEPGTVLGLAVAGIGLAGWVRRRAAKA